MALAFACDHCGVTFNKLQANPSPIAIINKNEGAYDICPDCTVLLEDFVHYTRPEE